MTGIVGLALRRSLVRENPHGRIVPGRAWRGVLGWTVPAGLSVLATVGPVPAGAQEETADATSQIVRAVRLDGGESVRLDGQLDDAIWQRTAPASGFRQQEPDEGEPARAVTEVHLAYDDQFLYVGVRLWDNDPGGIRASERRRDGDLSGDDRFMLLLDTFRDGQSGYYFEVNPAGATGDGLLTSAGLNRAWRGIWEARVARTDDGWSAELRIPFRTLTFSPRVAAWGVNFQRTVRRRGEESLWTAYRRNQGLLRPLDAGLLLGLEDIARGVGLDATPYLLGGVRAPPRDGRAATAARADVGLDLTYRITPALTAAASVNTDFAEVEADVRQVNLSRFPISFPERRDFFLEGARFFDFAPDNGVTPYFSRRIGLEGGRPVPIVGGLRLTGQTAGYDVAGYHVHTGAREDVPEQDFSAVRVVRRVLTESSLGVLWTRRAAGAFPGGGGQQTAGSDLTFQTSRFLGDHTLRLQVFGVAHSADSVLDDASLMDRTAWGARLTFPNRPVFGHVSYRVLGAAFDPALGFTPRRGFRRVQPSIGVRPRFGSGARVREIVIQARLEHIEELETDASSLELGLVPLFVRLPAGDQGGVQIVLARERLVDGFVVQSPSGPVAILPGLYTARTVSATFETAAQRPAALELQALYGGYWSGTRARWTALARLRPVAGLSVAAGAERNAIHVEDVDFVTTRTLTDLAWHATPRVALNSTLQYDNVTRELGAYVRLHWIIRPGSDVYLVYRHDWKEDDGPLVTLDRSATVKVAYTHRW